MMPEFLQWLSDIVPAIIWLVGSWFGVVDSLPRWLYMLVIPLLFYIAGSKHIGRRAGRAGSRMYKRIKTGVKGFTIQ